MILPSTQKSVLLGAAILGACASGNFDNIQVRLVPLGLSGHYSVIQNYSKLYWLHVGSVTVAICLRYPRECCIVFVLQKTMVVIGWWYLSECYIGLVFGELHYFLFVTFYHCIIPMGFLEWEMCVAFPGESQL